MCVCIVFDLEPHVGYVVHLVEEDIKSNHKYLYPKQETCHVANPKPRGVSPNEPMREDLILSVYLSHTKATKIFVTKLSTLTPQHTHTHKLVPNTPFFLAHQSLEKE